MTARNLRKSHVVCAAALALIASAPAFAENDHNVVPELGVLLGILLSALVGGLLACAAAVLLGVAVVRHGKRLGDDAAVLRAAAPTLAAAAAIALAIAIGAHGFIDIFNLKKDAFHGLYPFVAALVVLQLVVSAIVLVRMNRAALAALAGLLALMIGVVTGVLARDSATPPLSAQRLAFDVPPKLEAERTSCGRGSADSCNKLGMQLRMGGPGDAQHAVTAFEAACDLELAIACNSAAQMLRSGVDVPRDEAAASLLTQRAAALRNQTK